MHPASYLLIAILIATWARLYRPVRREVEGTTLQIAPLPLLAKLRMQAVPSAASLGLAVILAVTGNMPWWLLAVPVISTILLLAIPVHYTITDRGIRLGWTEFRRWTEFAGVKRASYGARLVGVSGKRSLSIWLSGSRGDDEFLHFLRQTQRRAYKGPAGAVTTDATAASVASIRPDADQTRIAAFTIPDGV